MDNNFKMFMDNLEEVFSFVEETLSAYSFATNMQFPSLLDSLAEKFDWSDSQRKTYDPILRLYIKDHEKYDLVRGAHGGITLRQVRQQKLAAKASKTAIKEAKEQIKAEIEAKINATVAAAKTIDISTNVDDSNQILMEDEEDTEE